MSLKLSSPSSADSSHARSVYMFSCDNCPAHELLGKAIDGCKIYSIPDDKGEFKNYFMKIDHMSHIIPKGYIGYSREKSIFTLSQAEAEENFGQHVCPSRLFFQPHLDPYADCAPFKNKSSQRLQTASLECKTTVDEGKKALPSTAMKTRKASHKRAHESTDDLLVRTGEAANSAFGAPVQRQHLTQDPWGLLQEGSLLKKGKENKPFRGSAVEDEVIETLCTNLGQFNLGHLKISRPLSLIHLLATLRE